MNTELASAITIDQSLEEVYEYDDDEDDEFCLQLYLNYLASDDPEKDETIKLEDLAAKLGITLKCVIQSKSESKLRNS